MKRTAFLAIAALSTISLPCVATTDRILQIGDDGQLEGLPPEYSPAFLRISFSSSTFPSPISSLELAAGNTTVVVPSCAMHMVNTRSIKDVRVSRGLGMDDIVLPDGRRVEGFPAFIYIKLFNPGHERDNLRSGYTLTFNLSDLRLTAMRLDVAFDDGESMEESQVELKNYCSSSELEEFADESMRTLPVSPNKSLQRALDP